MLHFKQTNWDFRTLNCSFNAEGSRRGIFPRKYVQFSHYFRVYFTIMQIMYQRCVMKELNSEKSILFDWRASFQSFEKKLVRLKYVVNFLVDRIPTEKLKEQTKKVTQKSSNPTNWLTLKPYPHKEGGQDGKKSSIKRGLRTGSNVFQYCRCLELLTEISTGNPLQRRLLSRTW